MDDLPSEFVNAVCQYIEHISGFIALVIPGSYICSSFGSHSFGTQFQLRSP